MSRPVPSKSMRPHAVVAMFPAQGHIGPLMELSIKFAREGFRITFATTPTNHAQIKHLQRSLRAQGLDIHLAEIIVTTAPEKFHHNINGSNNGANSGINGRSTAGRAAIVDMCVSPDSRLTLAFEELVRRRLLITGSSSSASSSGKNDDDDEGPAAPSLTCIVSDMFAPFDILAVAAKFKLPLLAFSPQAAGSVAAYGGITKHGRRPPPPGELVDWIPGVPPLKWEEVTTSLRSADPKEPMFIYVRRCYAVLEEATWVAINTFEELEEASLAALREDLGKPLYTIGPVLRDMFFRGSIDDIKQQEKKKQKNHKDIEHDDHESDLQKGKINILTATLREEDHSCLRWLDEQEDRSVVYVSFGSSTVLRPGQMRELALGLEGSGYALLWVIRGDLLEGADHHEGSTTVLPDDGGGFAKRVKDRACFVPWAPQKQVLAHRAVGGFLTHCGWNSTLESLSAGVPMLGWPYFADQMLNNRRSVDQWKIGLQLEADDMGWVSREQVQEKVTLLMQTSNQLMDNIQRWKQASHAAIQPGGSSNLQWEKLVHEMSQTSTLSGVQFRGLGDLESPQPPHKFS